MKADDLSIEVEELRGLLDTHSPVTVLDVRSAEERAEWSIPGSIHLPVYEQLKAGELEALNTVTPAHGEPVVMVCAEGNVSLVAAAALRDRGIFARSLAGGMKEWSLAWNSAECPLPNSDTGIVQVRRTGKGCLSYIVGSQGEAIVVDPALDPQIYIDLAMAYEWSITHVIDTHIHADHLMRSRILAGRTGAALHLPSNNRVTFQFQALNDGDILDIGNATIRVLATPGHTVESVSYQIDREAILTGDTLFVDGVGRPDLEVRPEIARERAHLLFQSLQRLLALPPETLVLPGHTNQPVPFDGVPVRATIKEISRSVPLLRAGEDEFVETLLRRIPPAPPNHLPIVKFNEAGIFPPTDPTNLEAGANRCAIS